MMLKKLIEAPKNNFLIAITTISGILFIVLMFLIYIPIFTSINTYTLTHLESAWTKEQVLIIFSNWDAEYKTQVITIVYFNFLYIFSYIVFLFGIILLEARKLFGLSQNIALLTTLTPIIAGIFNIIENLNLLVMLYNISTFPSFIPFIASLCSTIKNIFLFGGIALFLILLSPFVGKYILGY